MVAGRPIGGALTLGEGVQETLAASKAEKKATRFWGSQQRKYRVRKKSL